MAKSPAKRGRPKGMRAAQLDIQRKLYEHPHREKVIQTVYRAALDDDHKHQGVAMKLIMDRVLPVSLCDRDTDIGRQSVNVIITNIPSNKDEPSEESGFGGPNTTLIEGKPINDEEFD